jgi:hypothetical protein
LLLEISVQFFKDRSRLLVPQPLARGCIEMLFAGGALDAVELPDDRQHLRTDYRRRRHRLFEVPPRMRLMPTSA